MSAIEGCNNVALILLFPLMDRKVYFEFLLIEIYIFINNKKEARITFAIFLSVKKQMEFNVTTVTVPYHLY